MTKTPKWTRFTLRGVSGANAPFSVTEEHETEHAYAPTMNTVRESFIRHRQSSKFRFFKL